MAKDFFTGNAIPFEEFDVMADVEKRQEMIEKSGQMGVPVIVIGEDEIMVGFDEKHLKSILGL
jgi:glutaredoxin